MNQTFAAGCGRVVLAADQQHARVGHGTVAVGGAVRTRDVLPAREHQVGGRLIIVGVCIIIVIYLGGICTENCPIIVEKALQK